MLWGCHTLCEIPAIKHKTKDQDQQHHFYIWNSSDGFFQGDAASGVIFTLFFAGALYHYGAVVKVIRPNPPFHPETLLPIEWEYADDGNFAEEDENQRNAPICKEILEQWNLFVNEDKTDFNYLFIAGKDELDEKGEPLTL